MTKLRKAIIIACSLCVVYPSFAQVSSSQSLVKSIVCPNPCVGETNYKLVLATSLGKTISSDRGIIKVDSLIDVSPENYKLVLTVKFADGSSQTENVNLPVCDPIFPQPPILANYSICEGEPLPTLNAVVLTQGSTVDWYDKAIGGNKLATGTLKYQPSTSGTFYAISRISSTNCKSLSIASSTIMVSRQTCIEIFTKKISLR